MIAYRFFSIKNVQAATAIQ